MPSSKGWVSYHPGQIRTLTPRRASQHQKRWRKRRTKWSIWSTSWNSRRTLIRSGIWPSSSTRIMWDAALISCRKTRSVSGIANKFSNQVRWRVAYLILISVKSTSRQWRRRLNQRARNTLRARMAPRWPCLHKLRSLRRVKRIQMKARLKGSLRVKIQEPATRLLLNSICLRCRSSFGSNSSFYES